MLPSPGAALGGVGVSPRAPCRGFHWGQKEQEAKRSADPAPSARGLSQPCSARSRVLPVPASVQRSTAAADIQTDATLLLQLARGRIASERLARPDFEANLYLDFFTGFSTSCDPRQRASGCPDMFSHIRMGRKPIFQRTSVALFQHLGYPTQFLCCVFSLVQR